MSKESKQRFAEALKDLKGKLSAEALEEVNGILGTLNREFLDVEGDVNALYKESVQRKESLSEVQKELENIKLEKQKLEENDSSEKMKELEAERDKYKTDLEKRLENEAKATKEKFLTKFESIKDHKDFEKAKNFFKLPEVEDEKYKWDTLEVDDFESNLSELEKFEALGHFQAGDGSTPTPPNRKTFEYEDDALSVFPS